MEERYYLVPFWAAATASRYLVSEGRQVIGRSLRARIVIRDTSISREHAVIELRNGEVWLEDLDSKHGTFLNSARIRRAQVRPGDLIVLGSNVVMRLEAERPAAQSPPAEADAQGWVETPTGGEATGRPPSSEVVFAGALSRTPVRRPNLEAVGRLSMDAVPALYARLNAVTDQLKRSPGDIRPAIVVKWLEPLLDRVGRLMGAMLEAPGQSPPLVAVQDVVDEALALAAASLDGQELAVDAQVPAGLGLRVHLRTCAESLAAVLEAAACALPRGSVVTLEAAADDEGAELVVRLPPDQQLDQTEGRPQAAPLRRARELVTSMGGELTFAPGEVQLFVPAWQDDEYSPG